MDKFLLAKLAPSAELRPLSLGPQTPGQLALLQVEPRSLRLHALQAGPNPGPGQLSFAQLAQVALDPRLAIVSADLAHLATGSASPNCGLALAADGRLYELALRDRHLRAALTGGCETQAHLAGSFLECRLLPGSELNDVDGTDNCPEPGQLLQVLARRCLFTFRYTPAPPAAGSKQAPVAASIRSPSLEQVSRCTSGVTRRTFSRLVPLASRRAPLPVSNNLPLTAIECSDNSVLFVRDSNSLGELQPEPPTTSGSHSAPVRLMIGRTCEEALLVTLNNQLRLSGHAIQAADSEALPVQDPDRLLAEQPSFELELSWSIELAELEALHEVVGSLEANQSDGAPRLARWCCMGAAMWPTRDQSGPHPWPRLLVVAVRHQVLVFAFEPARAALPFVYDAAFASLVAGSAPESRAPDARAQPRLLHQLSLVGARPGDSPFNGLLLAPGARLLHLAPLGEHSATLCAVTEAGHVLALELSPQQLLADSVLGPSAEELAKTPKAGLGEQLSVCSQQLLADYAATLSAELATTRAQLERGLLSASNLVGAQLEVSPSGPAGRYSLQLQLGPAAACSRIVIVVREASVFAPDRKSCVSENWRLHHHRHEEEQQQQQQQQTSTPTGDFGALGPSPSGPLLAWAELDLEAALYGPEATPGPKLSLLVADNRPGWLDVLFELADELHSIALPIKPLHSYQLEAHELEPRRGQATHMTASVSGPFEAATAFLWLNELCQLGPASQESHLLRSPLTGCALQVKLEDKLVQLTSDDLLALELAKRHLLRRATEQSLPLDLDQNPLPGEAHLRHLARLQFAYLADLASRHLEERSDLSQSPDSNPEVVLEALLELLETEAGGTLEPPLEAAEFRSDLAGVVGASLHSSAAASRKPASKGWLELGAELSSALLLEALIQYDRLHGRDRWHGQLLAGARSKLNQLTQSLASAQSGSEPPNCDQFIGQVLGLLPPS